MASQACSRRAPRGRAGRSRRAAHCAPLRPSPRRALTRTSCRSRGCGLGGGAPARSRLHHRRSRLASLRDVELEERLRAIGRCYVVLGNHDFADSRDPFSQRVDPKAIAALENVTLLGDDAVEVELRRRSRSDRRRRPAGVRGAKRRAGQARGSLGGPADPPLPLPADRHAHPERLPPCARRAPARWPDRLPYPGGRLRLAHLGAREVEGLYDYGAPSCTCRPASARRSSRSGSSRVRR